MENLKGFFLHYFRIQFAFSFVFLLIRIYENHAVAEKFFSIEYTFLYEFAGLLYDIWVWLIYCVVILIPFVIFSLLHKKAGTFFLHFINIITIAFYISLIIVFSQRTMPFDHEMFTGSYYDKISIVKTFAVSGIMIYFPLFFYVLIYILSYHLFFKRISLRLVFLYPIFALMILASVFIKYSLPSKNYFNRNTTYYLVCNKLIYWATDSFQFFLSTDKYNENKSNQIYIDQEIDFYQKNQPFVFTSKEYPLIHENTSPDVLGNFFNFGKAPPNIVILVIESLSADFSGDDADPVSFTPFLDSLSKKSLCWNNFLSCAQGTFGAFPSIAGSLPFGKNGFSLMNVMPEHLSLVKILRQNGYYSYFMTGCDLDFDNLGEFLRLQGTDFILTRFGPKYKKMGKGSEGWSAGYSDDALFAKNFEVLDSVHTNKPYVSMFLTLTTHAPFIFDQSRIYDNLFDKKLKKLLLPARTRLALYRCKKLLRSFMFTDDCLRNFFNEYKKRKDFSNTIFIITGDHHAGDFPSKNDLDDFHVPFIIYSPMLKSPKKFYSVNSHTNVTPTILGMLNNRFQFQNNLPEVPWIGDVIDTCASFRNIHHLPFMLYSREIVNFFYENYFISRNWLYKITPSLDFEFCEDESIKSTVARMRDNFKFINSYVCSKNKIYPSNLNGLSEKKEVIIDFSDKKEQTVSVKQFLVKPIKDFKLLNKYKYLYVDVTVDAYLETTDTTNSPQIKLSIVDKNKENSDYLLWSNKNFFEMAEFGFPPKTWNTITVHDIFKVADYSKLGNLFFEVAFYTDYNSFKVKERNLTVKISGVK